MTRRDILNTPDDLSIKAATDELISAVGGQQKAEGYSRPDARRYSEYSSPNTNTFIPADAIVALEKRAPRLPGWPHVTRELARQTGHVLVLEPAGVVHPDADVNACAVVHAKESNDVTVRILALAPKGRLTRETVRDHELVREAREAVEAAVNLLATLEFIEGNDE